MSPSVNWRITALRLAVLGVCLGALSGLTAAAPPNSPPRFQNVSLTPAIGENGMATLRGEIRDPNPTDTFRLSISWGDGTLPQVLNYRAGTRWVTNYHIYT